jgi:YidC/Oxa1 family membrane protein insertase
MGSTSTHRLRPAIPVFQSAVFSQTFRNASTSAAADAATGDAVANSLTSEETVLAVPRISEQVGRISAADPSAVAPSNAGSMAVPVDSGVSHIPVASTTSPSSLPTSSILPQPPATADVPTIESLIAANPDNIAEVLASPEAVHAAMKIGDLKLMGLTHGMLNPAGWIRDALEAIHVGMGIPWWGTIMLTTACLRLALFPLVVRMQAHNSRMAAIADQQKVLMEKMGEVKAKGDQQGAQVYAAQLAQLWKEHDVHPVRSLGLPILQMPLFLAFFFALRKLVALPVPQLKEGGMAWFTDLTMADPYYILPVTSMALTLGVMQMGADGTGAAKSRQNQHMINGFRVATILAIPFVAQMASVSSQDRSAEPLPDIQADSCARYDRRSLLGLNLLLDLLQLVDAPPSLCASAKDHQKAVQDQRTAHCTSSSRLQTSSSTYFAGHHQRGQRVVLEANEG